MQVVVCRDNKVVASWQEVIRLNEISLRSKQIFIKYQSQDVYMQSTGLQANWLKIRFTFQVTKSGMHPTGVQYDTVGPDELPADMQMKLLMGAL